MDTQTTIESQGLTKKFGKTEALSGVGLEVPDGAIYALVGANGAGKTTLIKLLMNILRPTAGSARVLGMDSQRLRGRDLNRIGYVSENQEFPEWMTVGGMLAYLRPFYPTWDGALEGQLVRQFDLPVKLIVFNNSALAFVELEMKAAGMLDFATDLRNPDFAKMAEAAGVLGFKADVPEQVRPMLAQALSHPGPALVEVVVDRQELALPPSIKLDQVKGFSLFMMKAVLDGRARELIDLAKVNLTR